MMMSLRVAMMMMMMMIMMLDIRVHLMDGVMNSVLDKGEERGRGHAWMAMEESLKR